MLLIFAECEERPENELAFSIMGPNGAELHLQAFDKKTKDIWIRTIRALIA